MLFQGANCFHKCTLEVVTDAHNLSGSLHLSSKRPLCSNEFIKGKSWKLNYTVVQCGFKACVSLSCNGIFNFIQRVSQCNLCCHLGNGIAGCLTCQCRRTAYTGVYFNHTIFKAGGMKRKLHVTSSGNLKLIDDVQCRGTKHLIFFITQGLGRCNYDTVPGVNTHRINIFHITYGNAVACTIPHHFIFDFLPSCNTAFYQNLPHT